jgi:ABC-2 type transport system ATP-binding protein
MDSSSIATNISPGLLSLTKTNSIGMNVLSITNISKSYGSIKALDNLNLSVEAGQVMGLLGPNGSGKTTTLGIILGILEQSSGTFSWFGDSYGGDHRLHIGSILETPNFFPYLNADDNLDIVRQIKNLPKQRFDEYLDLVKLTERRKSPFRTYSLGMKQRLAIAATLIGDPEVVIFDEPTNGLDPEGIAEVRDTLKEIANRGKTVIMASHILDEVEKICSHVCIIKRGKLLASGPVGAILSDDITLEIAGSDNAALQQFLTTLPYLNSLNLKNNLFECTLAKGSDIAAINKQALDHGLSINHLVGRKRRLEEEFLEITNQASKHPK